MIIDVPSDKPEALPNSEVSYKSLKLWNYHQLHLVVSALHYILIILALVIYLGHTGQLLTRSCYTQISCANGKIL